MHTWSFNLEVVSPLFLGGAEQQAELRPPTFKHMMRWWFRAVKGARSQQEEALFGSTDQASQFRPRIRLGQGCIPQKKKPFFARRQDGKPLYPGVQYLGYSLKDTKDKSRDFIPAGATFELELAFRASLNQSEVEAILASLWLWLWLGGTGSRSRRGFGSLHITERNVDHHPLAFHFQGDLNQLKSFLKAGINKAIELIVPGEEDSPLPSFTRLTPKSCLLYLWNEPFDSWQRALDEAGQIMQNYRKQHGIADSKTIKAFLEDSHFNPKNIEKAAFGLPVEFYFKRSNSKVRVKGGFPNNQSSERDVKKKGHERRASPLVIKALKINERQYALMFLLMRAQLLEKDERIEIIGKKPKLCREQPTLRMVEDFLNAEVAPRSELLFGEKRQ